MYWRPPSQSALDAWGGARSVDDFPEPQTEVWHENWDICHWFAATSTQFVPAASGVIGFNYLVAHQEFDDMGLTGAVRDEWKWKLRVIERAALSHINKPT